MSDDEDDNPNKRLRRGESDGEYLLRRGALGPTNKFQGKWYQEEPPKGQPHRKHWLIDEGAGGDGQLMA
eukprot:1132209-Pelagomonas_calceolata.AAC.1